MSNASVSMSTEVQSKSYSEMGALFERVVGRRTARALAGLYPFPPPGDEIIVALNPETGDRLRLGNFNGTLVVLSRDVPASMWYEVFKVNL